MKPGWGGGAPAGTVEGLPLPSTQTSWVSQGTWQFSTDLNQDSESREISKLAAREADCLVENPDASLCLVSQSCGWPGGTCHTTGSYVSGWVLLAHTMRWF